MSSGIIHTASKACSYNLKSSLSLGWAGEIPDEAIEDFPDLACEVDTKEFAQAVMQLQSALGQITDGMLGRGTWSALLKRYDSVDDSQPFWTYNDRRIKVDIESPVRTVNFDQAGGLDLHRFGHFSRRKQAPHLIVVHWGGLDPHHCYRVFSSPNRKVSSHAGIGLSPEGDPTIYQYLDLNHKSWHAGWANSYSVGIDICQQPDLKWKGHYESKGYNVEETTNPTDRGSSNILSIDPLVALAVGEAVKSLCQVLDIPFAFPSDAHGGSTDDPASTYHGVVNKEALTSGDFRGVIGHHHITQKKWDCACWWNDIFQAERSLV